MVNNQPARIAHALTEAAKAIHSPTTLEETLTAIAIEAQRSIPGFDHVGISLLHRDGRIETMAGTDSLVWELDDLQYGLDEGPCLDSIKGAGVVSVEHARRDPRWPRFIPEAVSRGLRAQLAVQLFLEDAKQPLGGLNMYSTRSETIDPAALEIAELFATHAAIALGRARHEHQLNEALVTRKTIGQAIGVVMERYEIDEDRAFHFLLRVSRSSNIKLRDVAHEVVDTSNHRYRRPESDAPDSAAPARV